MGRATLSVPQQGNIGPSFTDELSDGLAMSYGTLFARLLPDNAFVTVTLESGAVIVIGHNTLAGKLIIRRLSKGVSYGT